MSRIAYDRTTIFGKMTAETINSILLDGPALGRLVDTMNQAVGSPPVWANLEDGDFGVSTGNGEAFYNTIVTIKVAMDAISPFAINSLDMGG
jgi:coproporphyrinogen III oxidase